ncbi:MAG TPA: hypothetical protein VNT81_05845, partial [Vicinamibacterales bacterium]|nr:hypothetical protein [Vicinamibacterales bacterium]
QPVPQQRSRWREVALVAVIFVASSAWGTTFWNSWVRAGGQPEFYQLYFEPAVMVACGKGFGLSLPQPKPLEDFLNRRTDRLACSELPADLPIDQRFLFQAAWTYLLYTVGLFWWAFGISWSGMGPLFGVFFGSVTTIAYGIFRVGMNQLFAVLGAAAIATSSLHLINLPHLRDYSKAPFTLGLVLILALLVTLPVRRLSVLALSAAYGAVLGLGYGFRTDLLINLPLLIITVFAFLPGGFAKHLALKAASVAIFLGAFYVVSLPITSAVATRGGCQWHVALLGLQPPFNDRLKMQTAPFSVGDAYADGYVIRQVRGYADRMDPQAPPPVYCSPEFDRFSGGYLMAIVATIPGDLVARAYASIVQIVEVPFDYLTSPLTQGGAKSMFDARQRLLRTGTHWGFIASVVAVVLVSALSIRLGLFLVFFLGYFGGYPAVQFNERHFFHLEFMGWWAIGFVACAAYVIARSREWPGGVDRKTAWTRIAVVSITTVIGLSVLIAATRWYQQRQLERLVESYLAAPTEPVDGTSALAGVADRDWPQMMAVDVEPAACGAAPGITFAYDPSAPDANFKKTVALRPDQGTTRIFQPVFEKFAGLEATPPGCVLKVERFTQPDAFPLLFGVVLPPDWRLLPFYQRMTW